MKITVDWGRCVGHGICESLAPEVFEIADDGHLVVKTDAPPADQFDAVRKAVADCPALALQMQA